MTNKINFLVAMCLSTTGCASTISAIHNDPARVHTLRPNRFFTLSGNSRMAFQVERYDKEHPEWSVYTDNKTKHQVHRLAWCAESLPEVSQAVTAASKPNLKIGEKLSGGTEDNFATTLTQTFARTEIAEIYRQMGWQACQAWAEGVMSDEAYERQLTAIINTGASVIEKRASQSISADTGKAAADAAAAAKKKVEDDAARKKLVDACVATPTSACVKALYGEKVS